MRALENLRLLLQLPYMAQSFIERSGLHFLFQLYIASTFSFSTLRILLLEVLLVLAQYPKAANIMACEQITDPDIYELLSREDDALGFTTNEKPPVRNSSRNSRSRHSRHSSRSRSRARNKKSKDKSEGKSRDKSKRNKDNSKERKEKKKRKYSDESDDSRDRKKGKSKKDKKGKDKKKSRSKTPEKKSKKEKDTKDLHKQTSQVSFSNSNAKKKP